MTTPAIAGVGATIKASLVLRRLGRLAAQEQQSLRAAIGVIVG